MPLLPGTEQWTKRDLFVSRGGNWCWCRLVNEVKPSTVCGRVCSSCMNRYDQFYWIEMLALTFCSALSVHAYPKMPTGWNTQIVSDIVLWKSYRIRMCNLWKWYGEISFHETDLIWIALRGVRIISGNSWKGFLSWKLNLRLKLN